MCSQKGATPPEGMGQGIPFRPRRVACNFFCPKLLTIAINHELKESSFSCQVLNCQQLIFARLLPHREATDGVREREDLE
jgi:hypothetical protein